ncbi:MAG: primosomal protein N' [Candidatus Omnitrophica bacterium]|nr:primosomal protein N' [Candidatus Omnitrophota bacterium]
MQSLLDSISPCVNIAVPLPIEGLYTYTVPHGMEDKARAGVRVRVPFKNRELIGYIVGDTQSETTARLKAILEVLDEEPVVSASMLELTRWISEEYGSSWGEAIENALPKWVKYGKKAEKSLAREKKAAPVFYEQKADLKLTEDQTHAFRIIQDALGRSETKPILLYGVTGSGKSEIYIRAIREVIARKKSAICLVPEIALTEQIRRFFLHHFGNELEVLHSKLSDGERFLAWKRIENGERKVVLGPRSAVFAPIPHLGLIVMDEEHEGSYKQETVPRYHAREVAAWRAGREGALFVLGTATPSLETMYRTEKAEVIRVDLSKRIDEKAMPEVKLIDLKDAVQSRKRAIILSAPLVTEIEHNLQRKEGTLLLLNRRGFSTHIHCPRCGTVETCVSCQVSLTFHQEAGLLLCHYCNFQKAVPEICSNCKTPMLRFAGYGTERVESDVAQRWPGARIARMDTDSVRKKGSHEKILDDFRREKIDILIGTQMIAKGFDFPHVTLVGVILADVGLMLPDFRSSERTFQLLTQVAGRAGRGLKAGRVLIQTFSPDHPSVRFAQKHDYLNFYRHELSARLEHGYPPCSRLINFIVRSHQEKKAYLYARELRDLLKRELLGDDAAAVPQAIQIIGPSPLPFYKLRGHFRWHVMIKVPRGHEYPRKIWGILPNLKKQSGVAMMADVDPLNIL